MGQPIVVALTGHTVPMRDHVAAAAVLAGDLLIMDNAGGGIGRVKEIVADDNGFTTASIEGGIVGVAQHDAEAGEKVQVAILTSFTELEIMTYSTAPTETLFGVAPTTYYAGRNDGGTFKANLGSTVNGVFRFTGFVWDAGRPFSGSPRAIPDMDGWAAGDKIRVAVPSASRFYSAL